MTRVPPGPIAGGPPAVVVCGSPVVALGGCPDACRRRARRGSAAAPDVAEPAGSLGRRPPAVPSLVRTLDAAGLPATGAASFDGFCRDGRIDGADAAAARRSYRPAAAAAETTSSGVMPAKAASAALRGLATSRASPPGNAPECRAAAVVAGACAPAAGRAPTSAGALPAVGPSRMARYGCAAACDVISRKGTCRGAQLRGKPSTSARRG